MLCQTYQENFDQSCSATDHFLPRKTRCSSDWLKSKPIFNTSSYPANSSILFSLVSLFYSEHGILHRMKVSTTSFNFISPPKMALLHSIHQKFQIVRVNRNSVNKIDWYNVRDVGSRSCKKYNLSSICCKNKTIKFFTIHLFWNSDS